jgi:hypothetical protein
MRCIVGARLRAACPAVSTEERNQALTNIHQALTVEGYDVDRVPQLDATRECPRDSPPSEGNRRRAEILREYVW